MRKLDLPLQSRAAPVSSVDTTKRTFDLVWTSGAAVKRYDWLNDVYYNEELALDPKNVRMDRLNAGAPLLNSHSAYTLDDVIGVVETAALAEGEGTATVRMSAREDVAPILQDVSDKILRNVSVGYRIYMLERIAPAQEGDLWTYRAIDWEPFEISLVPIPADAGAQVRGDQTRTNPCVFVDPPANSPAIPSKESTMAEEALAAQRDADELKKRQDAERAEAQRIETARLDAESKARADKAAATAVVAERARVTEIQDLGRSIKLGEDFLRKHVDAGTAVADFSRAALEEKARLEKLAGVTSQSTDATRIRTMVDEGQTRREAMIDAIRVRHDPKHKVTEASNHFRGLSLLDMARDSIEAAGGTWRGMSKKDVASCALNLDGDLRGRAGMMSTSDFPYALANTVNRTLRQAYEQSPQTFRLWARPSTNPDFRPVARLKISGLSAFQQINEGGEYKAMVFADGQEKYALSKYGGIIPITWETIINDDLNMLGRIPQMIGNEAAALEGDIVYSILTTNAAMADTVALFHATHKNLATGSAVDITNLGLMRTLMRTQKAPAPKAGATGRVVNIVPKYLLVPPAREQEAYQYTSATYVPATAGNVNPEFNRSLIPVVDDRLSASQSPWYMVADPDMIDTVEYATLEGEGGVFTETRQGFEVDGVQIKARHVFAAKAIDWIGMVKNPGA